MLILKFFPFTTNIDIGKEMIILIELVANVWKYTFKGYPMKQSLHLIINSSVK